MAVFRRDPITKMALPPLKPPGRKKGVPNKISKTMKEAFKEAFEQLGGVPKLVEWAERNPDKFYTLIARLLPVDITSGGEAITPTIVKVNFVAPNPRPELPRMESVPLLEPPVTVVEAPEVVKEVVDAVIEDVPHPVEQEVVES
jgi:hypothetical protein